jgi:hypothetical protein
LELLSHGKLSVKDITDIKLIIRHFQTIGLIHEIQSRTIDIFRVNKLKRHDAIIAATASVLNETCVGYDSRVLNVKQSGLNAISLDCLRGAT